MKAKSLAGLAVLALLLVGCRTVPIHNVKEAPVTVGAGQTASVASVEQAILRAGSGLGWAMKVEKPGLIAGTLALRGHTAMVEIPYSRTSYSILYKNSVNLEQHGDMIHKNYNGWVQNLDQAIKRQLMN
jgi:hypothetical protein